MLDKEGCHSNVLGTDEGSFGTGLCWTRKGVIVRFWEQR